MNRSESIADLAKALSKFHEEVEQPTKSADNPFFKSKYVPLPAVIATVDKYAPKQGLTYVQTPVTDEKGVGVITIIMHESGQFMEFDPFYLAVDKKTAQGMGSSITYARRYSLSAAFGLDSDFDDDGNEASGNSSNTSNKPNKQQNYQSNTNTPPPQQNTNTGGFKASDAQVKLLHKLTKEYAQKSSYTEDQIKKSLTNHVGEFGMSYKEMSGGKGNQASQAIEKLNDLLKGFKNGREAFDNEVMEQVYNENNY